MGNALCKRSLVLVKTPKQAIEIVGTIQDKMGKQILETHTPIFSISLYENDEPQSEAADPEDVMPRLHR